MSATGALRSFFASLSISSWTSLSASRTFSWATLAWM